MSPWCCFHIISFSDEMTPLLGIYICGWVLRNFISSCPPSLQSHCVWKSSAAGACLCLSLSLCVLPSFLCLTLVTKIRPLRLSTKTLQCRLIILSQILALSHWSVLGALSSLGGGLTVATTPWSFTHQAVQRLTLWCVWVSVASSMTMLWSILPGLSGVGGNSLLSVV